MLIGTGRMALALGAAVGVLVAAAGAQPEAPARQPQPGEQRPAGDRPARPEGQPGQEGRAPAGRAPGSGEITNVEAAMKLINRSARKLKGQIADPAKKDENLKLVSEIERAVVAAKAMPVPEPRKGGPGGPGGREQPGGGVRDDANETQPEPKSPAKDGAKQPERKPEGAVDAAKRPEEYRRELMKLLRQMIDIEQDLMDGKFDQAKAGFDKLPQMRDDAHRELGVRQGKDRD